MSGGCIAFLLLIGPAALLELAEAVLAAVEQGRRKESTPFAAGVEVTR